MKVKLLKRILSLSLAISIIASMNIVAFAKEDNFSDVQKELAEVTKIVKGTLRIQDDYDEFYGEHRETELGRVWSLQWSNDDSTISIECTSKGKITRYFKNTNSDIDPYMYSNTFNPQFPSMTTVQAQSVALKFFSLVLDRNEKAEFTSDRKNVRSPSIYLYGYIKVDGLNSPMTFNITVDCETSEVISFTRGDQSTYIGTIQTKSGLSEKITDDAYNKLLSTVAMKIEYELDEETNTAHLIYKPLQGNKYYYDAEEQRLINITSLQSELEKEEAFNGMADTSVSMSDDAGGSSYLSETEKLGIKKLDGVLDQTAIDTKLKANYPELKLDTFKVTGINYYINKNTNEVSAYIRYGRTANKSTDSRTVVVNAKTAVIESMYGYDAYDKSTAIKVKTKDARAAVDSILNKLWKTEYATMELSELDTPDYASDGFKYTFTHRVNGYSLPSNYIRVTVSSKDGSILGISKNYVEGIKFDDPSGVISITDARKAWTNSFDLGLKYIAVSAALNLNDISLYNSNIDKEDYKYYSKLRLGYELSRANNRVGYKGIDAKTGSVVKYDTSYSEKTINYKDINDYKYRHIFNILGEYGIGWETENARPSDQITQEELLALLASADQYSMSGIILESSDDAKEEVRNRIYNWAYRVDALKKSERNPEKKLTRLEAEKILINALGYRKLASKNTMFNCTYKDKSSIPVLDIGYAAILQGFNIVNTLELKPNDPATREFAILSLYNYMVCNK